MNKTLNTDKSSQLLAIFFLILLPCLSVADEIKNQFEMDTLNLIEKFQNVNDGLKKERKPAFKGKSEIEKIKGTWLFSYTVNGVVQTDKLVINETYQASDGEWKAFGNVFFNNTSDGEELGCSELSGEAIVSHFSANYMCMAFESSSNEQYVFRVSGDKLTNGYFGQGSTVSEAGTVSFDKTIVLTGGRENTNPSGSDSYYDEATGEIVIPSLIYKGTKLKVILEDKGGFSFSVKEAEPL